MHLRINDVTVAPGRVDELGEVVLNKALPVVAAESGYRGLTCSADRTTGNCAIVSLWDTREALDGSERAVASIRSATIDAVDATLNSLVIAEILREVRVGDSLVGTRTRAVRLSAPADSAEALVDFYDSEAVPRLKMQAGFLNARLIRDTANGEHFVAVSHWRHAAALEGSDVNSKALRELVTTAVPGASIEQVSTGEIILIERP